MQPRQGALSGRSHRKYLSSQMGSYVHTLVTVFSTHAKFEIDGHTISIVGIVIVRVAVAIDITEIVAVVLID